MKRIFTHMLLVGALGVPAYCAPDAVSTSDGDDPAPRSTVREISARVSGASGALSGATIRVTLSEAVSERPAAMDLDKGRTLHTEMLTTDAAGRYSVSIPDEFIGIALLRIAVNIEYPGYLSRRIGPVPVSDFDGREITNQEPYWLSRRISRSALQETRIRQGTPVNGRVLTSDGAPAIGATVVTSTKYQPYAWKFASRQRYRASDEDTTDGDGRFSLLADQRATMLITLEGHAPLVVDNLHEYVATHEDDPPFSYRLPISIRLHGRVQTNDGSPIPYAIIRADRDTVWDEFDMPLSLGRLCVADENGEYGLPPLPPGAFKFAINTRLENPEQATELNRLGQSNSRYETPYLPLSDVILVETAEYDGSDESTALDFRAVESNTITVRFELPQGEDSKTRRAPYIPIRGMLNGEHWGGISIPLEDYDAAVFNVPHGVQSVAIGTGPALLQRSADAPVEIGEALHIGNVDEDLSGFVVSLPQLARLTIQLELPEEIGAGNSNDISYVATYVEPGHPRHPPGRQVLHLFATSQTGATQFRAWALPDQEINLAITNRKANTLLHQQRLTLTPGEHRELRVDLRK